MSSRVQQMRWTRSSSTKAAFLLIVLTTIVIFAMPAQEISAAEISAIVVRFAPGEVSYPEAVYPETAPLERVLFRTPQVRQVLAESGVHGLSLVCPGWRHISAPRWDLNGVEIAVDQMVDFADVYKLEWTRVAIPEEIRSDLSRLEQVEYVDLMLDIQLDSDPPDDAYFDEQWGLHNSGQSFCTPCVDCSLDVDLNMPEAWEMQDTCTVLVGIIDDGIDRDHEDLADAVHLLLHFGIEDGEEEAGCSWPHGSAVAGIVGAVGGNDSGVVGVASPKGGRILVPMRAGPDGPCQMLYPLICAEALCWASTTAFPQIAVLNNSYSWDSTTIEGVLVCPQPGQCYPTLRDAVRNAYLTGLFLTASAGNRTGGSIRKYPAAFPDFTTAVGAVLCTGEHPPGYNEGSWIDIVAPGGGWDQGGGPTDSLAFVTTPWGGHSGSG